MCTVCEMHVMYIHVAMETTHQSLICGTIQVSLPVHALLCTVSVCGCVSQTEVCMKFKGMLLTYCQLGVGSAACLGHVVTGHIPTCTSSLPHSPTHHHSTPSPLPSPFSPLQVYNGVAAPFVMPPFAATGAPLYNVAGLRPVKMEGSDWLVGGACLIV